MSSIRALNGYPAKPRINALNLEPALSLSEKGDNLNAGKSVEKLPSYQCLKRPASDISGAEPYQEKSSVEGSSAISAYPDPAPDASVYPPGDNTS